MNDHTQLADFPKERKGKLTPHISRKKTPLMTLESDLNLPTERTHIFPLLYLVKENIGGFLFAGEEEQYVGAYTCICVCF